MQKTYGNIPISVYPVYPNMPPVSNICEYIASHIQKRKSLQLVRNLPTHTWMASCRILQRSSRIHSGRSSTHKFHLL